MKKFELKSWMTENREIVIESHKNLTTEEHYNGISLKDFMVQVYRLMEINNPRSEKRAASLLPDLMEDVYWKNKRIEGNDATTERLAKKYEGTAAMALV